MPVWPGIANCSTPASTTHARSGRTPPRAVTWIREPQRILDDSNPPFYRWFPDGELNTCANALDRHVADGRGDQAALIYDSPVTDTKRTYTYARTARRDGPVRRRAARPRRRQGRPRGDLHADGARGGHRDAGLRPAGRRALGGVRRLRRARAGGAHRRRAPRGRRVGVMRHRADPHRRLQADARRRARHRRAHHPARASSCSASSMPCELVAGPRRRLGRGDRRRRARRPRPGRRDRSALRAVHVGHHRQAQGHRPRQRRARRRAAVDHAPHLRHRSPATCSGPLRMSAGWSATPTSSTGRCCSARRPCSTRASRSARPTRARSGGWPPSTA